MTDQERDVNVDEEEIPCMCDDLGKCTRCVIEELRAEMGI